MQPLTKYFETFYLLVYLPFTTSEMYLDYYHQKLYVRVPSKTPNDLRLRKTTELNAAIA